MAQATDRTEAEVNAATSRIRPHVRDIASIIAQQRNRRWPFDYAQGKARMRSHPVWTRRRFLGHLGAVGGSSLVMTAMTSWDLMAGQAGVRPVLSGRPSGVKVLILGAGVSGLVAGYELSRLGYDFRILEARDRVGGLAWTVRRGTEHTEIGGERQVCTFDEGQHVNVGAWRIPYTHTGVLNYCKELGVPLQIFLNEADGSYFYYEGTAAGSLSNTRVRLREVKADLIGHTNELLAKAIDQRRLDVPLTAEDQQRLVGYLVAHGYLSSSDRAYKAFVHRGPGTPYELSALLQSGFGTRLRSIPASDGTTAAPMFHPVGGMDQFAKGFERANRPHPHHLQRRRPVVHQGDTGVKVVYANTKTGQKTELAADFVVICMPLSVLAGVDVNLSSDMMQAVRATTVQQQRQDGAGHEAPVLGGGRADLRWSSLLEPAARRVLVPVA
jgi:monoamine oxidase